MFSVSTLKLKNC